MSLSQYLLEFSICLALFYGLYHFLLRKETFFQLNRWYLLLSPVLAMLIPFLDWELSAPAVSNSGQWDRIMYPLVTDIQHPQEVFWETVGNKAMPVWQFTYLDALLLIYGLGVLWMGSRLLYRTWKLMRLIGRSRQERRPGYTEVRLDGRIPAASFLSYVFWEEGPLSPERKSMLEHELVHVRQWHSLDVLLMEIWVMLKWFHPMIYWYRNSLRLTHEYIADEYVSRSNGSRLEYARLLTTTTTTASPNKLLHYFDSSVRMRLIMLAKQQSGGWKYLRFLGVIPITTILLMLFSFNLANELPKPLTQPLSNMEQTVQELVKQPLLSNEVATMPEKNYHLKWGELECPCQNQEFPNFYRCLDKSMRASELRRLIRAEGGFILQLGEQEQQIMELTAVSKFMKDMGGFKGQFDEMNENFNTTSPLWKQAEKGDVFRFTFTNGAGDHFAFEVVINDGKDVYAFGNRVEIGAMQFNLSQFSSHLNMKESAGGSVITLDLEELKDIVRSPLKVRQSTDDFYVIKAATIRNFRALRAQDWKGLNSEALDLSQCKAILEAQPGDAISLTLITESSQQVMINIHLRENAAWDGPKRNFHIQWGDRSFDAFQNIVLFKEEISSWMKDDLYLVVNGEKYRVEPSILPYGILMNEERFQSFDAKVDMEKFLQFLEPGHSIYLNGVKTEGDYMMPSLTLYIAPDWRVIFAGDRNVRLSVDRHDITLLKTTPRELDLLMETPYVNLFYSYEVEGMEPFYKRRMEKPLLRQWLDQHALGKALKIRRRDCLNCLE